MNIDVIKQTGAQFFGRGLLLAKKFAPEILTGVGVVGVVAAGVMGAKATLKLEATVDHSQARIDGVKRNNSVVTIENVPCKSELAQKKDLTAAHIHGVVDVAKLYSPAVTLGLASVGCILAAHGIMRKRNAALVAAYNVIDKAFSNYRSRFVEEFGEEKDREYVSGLRRVEQINETTGKKEIVTVVDANGYSPFARFFDKDSTQWDPTPEYSVMFLKMQQQYANDRLRSRGHLFLNEVYEELGLSHTSEGAVLGWLWKGEGDDFVDFGMDKFETIRAGAIIDGTEGHILLDFNVDGVIYDKI